MTMKQGFAAAYFELPALRKANLAPTASLGILAEGEDILKGQKSFHSLPSFNTYFRQSYYVDVFNKGTTPLKWKASVSDNWILLSQKAGETATENRIEVSIAEIDSLFVEHNGYVSIDAAGFHRKVENKAIQMRTIPNLGIENTAIQLGDPTAAPQRTAGRSTPRLEYDFYTFEQGSVDVYTYVLPTFTLSKDRGYAGHEATNVETKYGVCIDEGPVMNPSTSSFEYAQIWYESVLKNCRINKTTLHIDKPGKHTVKIICGDAGTVLQKIVLDFGGMKRSYLGPQPTRQGK